MFAHEWKQVLLGCLALLAGWPGIRGLFMPALPLSLLAGILPKLSCAARAKDSGRRIEPSRRKLHMPASNLRKVRLQVFLGIFVIGFVPGAQASPIYGVVDLGLQSASPTVPDTLINPRLTNAAGDSASTIPIYAQPGANETPVSLGPIGFYAEFVPHDGNALRIGLQGSDFANSAVSAINNSDQVVGESWSTGGISHAFVVTGGQIFDLNNLIPSNLTWTITSVLSIDDQGRILADATSAGVSHTVMLVPEAVPEPSMAVVALFLLGGASIQVARRRRSGDGSEPSTLK